MIAEPILLGLFLAPSLGSLSVAACCFIAFLARTPLIRLLKSRRVEAPDPHARAVRKMLMYCAGSGVLFSLLSFEMAGWSWTTPLIVGGIPGAWVLLKQSRGQTRKLLPEVVAGMALATPVTAMGLAGGLSLRTAGMLGVVLAAKSASTILFVRSQVLRIREQDPQFRNVHVMHGILLASFILLYSLGLIPVGVPVCMSLLWLRLILLSKRPLSSAKQVGWIEVGVSLAFVAGIVIAYRI